MRTFIELLAALAQTNDRGEQAIIIAELAERFPHEPEVRALVASRVEEARQNRFDFRDRYLVPFALMHLMMADFENNFPMVQVVLQSSNHFETLYSMESAFSKYGRYLEESSQQKVLNLLEAKIQLFERAQRACYTEQCDQLRKGYCDAKASLPKQRSILRVAIACLVIGILIGSLLP